MASGLRRVYARWGIAGLAVVATGGALAASTANVAVITRVLLAYVEEGADPWFTAFARAQLMALAGILVAVVLSHRSFRVIFGWVGAGRTPAAAPLVWRTLVDFPKVLITRVAVCIAVLEVPWTLWFADRFGEPAAAAPLYVLALAGTVANCVFVAFLIALVLRPAAQDLARHLPAEFSPGGQAWRLQRKILAPIPGASIFAGLLVGAATATTADTTERLTVAVAVACLCGLVSLVLFVVSTRSTLEPVDRLIDATQRVRDGDLTADVPVVAADELGELAQSFNRMVAGLRERESLHRAFGHYVNPDLADRVLGGEVVEGEQVDVTVLFLDIRNFTKSVELADPRDTVAALNAFFALVLPIVGEHGGHVNKLLGDGLLAVFGAPTPMTDHADRGLAAGRALVDAVHDTYGDELRIGVGISSGPVIAGTIGGPDKLDYTLIGDTVNVASRVEQLTTETGDPLLLTHHTLSRLTGTGHIEPRGRRRLRGREGEVTIYAATSHRRQTMAGDSSEESEVRTLGTH